MRRDCIYGTYRQQWMMRYAGCMMVDDLMNNNKSESHQKLRLLYQRKFIPENGEETNLGNANRIQFKHAADSNTHSKRINIAFTFTQQASWNHIDSKQHKATQSSARKRRERLHISLNYAQMQQSTSTCQYQTRQSRSANRKTVTSEGRRDKVRSDKLKTLVLPNTSRDSLATPKQAKSKKYSLQSQDLPSTQMIEQIKLMKQAGHAKIAMQVIENGLSFEDKTAIKYKDSLNSKQKSAPFYYKSTRVLCETFRERKNSVSHPKEYQIDPWVVSENEEEAKKYY